MMKQKHLLFLTVLLTILLACNGESRATPTPFPENAATEQALNTATPSEISITDLATDPEAYANTFMKVTGRYRRLPLLVCNTDPHPAPATWQLEAEDGSLIAVGGFDSQVRSLLPNNLTVSLAGVWQLFDGPVGCGKNAATTQIWYLKASDILSPSPIAQVTLTPTGSASQIAEGVGETAVPDPNDPGTLSPTPTLGTPEEEPGSTPSAAPEPTEESTPTITTPQPTNEADATNSPTPTGSTQEGTITPTTDNTASPTAGSGAATATPTSSSAPGSATATPGALTTATRNPSDYDTVEFDDLSPETPVLELLAAEEAHLWPIAFDYDGAITITAVAEPTMNLVLEILNPVNDVVQQANSGGNGDLEAIVNAELNVALNYKIRLYDLNGLEGDYCLIFSEGGGFPDTIKGRIEYGQTKTGTVPVLGIDYWCFLGASGDTVSISSTATGSAGDFVLGLFGPPDFDAIGSVFQDPEIMNASLSENGMFMIGVLDFEAGASGYSLTLTKN